MSPGRERRPCPRRLQPPCRAERHIPCLPFSGSPTDVTINYALQLWVGSTLLASASNVQSLPVNGGGTDSASYTSGPNNPLAGQTLMIVITTTGAASGISGAYFDDIALTATGATPAISANGVVSASAFGGFTSGFTLGSWIEIYGSNLAADTRPWAGSDFNGINAPTSLDGTRVTVGRTSRVRRLHQPRPGECPGSVECVSGESADHYYQCARHERCFECDCEFRTARTSWAFLVQHRGSAVCSGHPQRWKLCAACGGHRGREYQASQSPVTSSLFTG